MRSPATRFALRALAIAVALSACTQTPTATGSAAAPSANTGANTSSSSIAGGTTSAAAAATGAPAQAMSFFVTSVGVGKGADLGGLAGADRHCQTLATAAGVGSHTWRAYMSTTAGGGAAPVDARDRIGSGPWRNAKGVVIAGSVDELHGSNHIDKQTALNEKGEVVNGRGDSPNMHDMLTGSTPDGRATDATCNNWTSSSSEGSAMLGHHDRTGLDDSAAAHSWNSSHPSRGCSQDALKSTGGAGLFYCFAVK